MDGSMNLEQALEERLRIINCTPADIKRFIKAHPPESRLVPVSNSSGFIGSNSSSGSSSSVCTREAHPPQSRIVLVSAIEVQRRQQQQRMHHISASCQAHKLVEVTYCTATPCTACRICTCC
jgi:hypothetical protein